MKKTFLKIRINDQDYFNFQQSCESKEKTMSDVIRYFIDSYTKSENLILLNIDDETLSNVSKLCKEKKIKFDKLVKFLLGKAIKNKDKLNIK